MLYRDSPGRGLAPRTGSHASPASGSRGPRPRARTLLSKRRRSPIPIVSGARDGRGRREPEDTARAAPVRVASSYPARQRRDRGGRPAAGHDTPQREPWPGPSQAGAGASAPENPRLPRLATGRTLKEDTMRALVVGMVLRGAGSSGVCPAARGHDVVCVDVDAAKVAKILAAVSRPSSRMGSRRLPESSRAKFSRRPRTCGWWFRAPT